MKSHSTPAARVLIAGHIRPHRLHWLAACIAVAFLIASPIIARSESNPSTAPAGEASSTPATDPAAEPLWKFNSYLTGTTSQIRDKLNGETERLTILVAETARDLRDLSADIESRLKTDMARVRKDPGYLKLQADFKVAEQVHEQSTGPDRLAASSHMNKVKAAIDKMEEDALNNDAALVDDRKRLREAKLAQNTHQQSLEKAKSWRQDLIDAIRNGFKLRWPITEDSSGTLGIVIPRQITSQGIRVDYDAAELVGHGKDGEGITEYRVIPHRVDLYVCGIDTSKMKEGQPVAIDRNFVIDKIVKDDPALETLYVLKPAPAAIDGLFESILNLRILAAK